jgi:hypothetical protein
MKKKNIIAGLSVLTVLAIAVGTNVVSAAETSSGTILEKTRNRLGRNVENRPELTEEQKAEMAARRSEMEAKMAVVQKALEANDYNAWVAAQKAMNEDCPLLEKINADNFGEYVAANNLRMQAGEKMRGLGLEGDERPGLGFGRGQGMGERMGRKMGGGCQAAQE